MSVQNNINIVRNYWEEVWNQGQIEAVADYYAPHCVHGTAFSIERFQENVSGTRFEFPDLNIALDDIFGFDDRVVCRVTYTGTHLGSTDNQPPTGKSFRVPGIDIFHLAEGKFVEHWHSVDHLKIMRQLGLVST